MRKLLCLSIAACLAFAVPVRAEDDAKKVVEAALKAHGGLEKLTKNKDKGVIQKGKMKLFFPIEAEGPFEMSTSGDKFRREWNFSLNGMDLKNVAVFDGKGLYVTTAGNTMSFDKPEDIDVLKEAIHSEKMGGLALLGDKSIELALIGEDKVDDTPVIGVRASSKGHKDVNLYFDKKTHLLKKIVGRTLDFESRMEVEQVKIMEEYAEADGLKRPSRVAIYKDGKKQIELTVDEVKHVDKFDDDTFAKPKD